MRAIATVIAFAAAACATTHGHPAPATGSVIGLARDHDSGDPVAKANLVLRAQGDVVGTAAVTDGKGAFTFDRVAPGTYSLSATFAGQPIDVEHIVVRAGAPAVVDVTFTLGHPDAVYTVFGDPKAGAIDRYHPRGIATTIGRLEGTVNDASTRERVAGAVVTAIGPGADKNAPVLQTVSDDQGRFAFDAVPPGVYVVSAYYSVGNRGQIEIRRSEIPVAGGEGVIVPLWVEMSR